MKLSVLDQSLVSSGATASATLQNTIDLARHADRLGYDRFWIAEHHTPNLASPAPEILIARIGAETSGIRVGSGAVLLPHYAPYKVAEVFRMLHALYPGRIDLGLGRAPGGGMLEAVALQRHRSGNWDAEDFPQQLVELLAFLRQEFPPDHPFSRIRVMPEMPGGPEPWLLGSSTWSASAAGQLGLPYAFAHFFGTGATLDALRLYHQSFKPRRAGETPRTMLTLRVTVAETREEAEFLSLSGRAVFLRARRGDLRPVPSPEEAAAEMGAELRRSADPGAGGIPEYLAGDRGSIRGQLEDILRLTRVDEIMVVAMIHDHAARVRSFSLLAEACGLAARA